MLLAFLEYDIAIYIYVAAALESQYSKLGYSSAYMEKVKKR